MQRHDMDGMSGYEEVFKGAPAAWAKFRNDDPVQAEALARTTAELSRKLADKGAATAFLKRHGFLTPAGRIPKKYGG